MGTDNFFLKVFLFCTKRALLVCQNNELVWDLIMTQRGSQRTGVPCVHSGWKERRNGLVASLWYSLRNIREDWHAYLLHRCVHRGLQYRCIWVRVDETDGGNGRPASEKGSLVQERSLHFHVTAVVRASRSTSAATVKVERKKSMDFQLTHSTRVATHTCAQTKDPRHSPPRRCWSPPKRRSVHRRRAGAAS